MQLPTITVKTGDQTSIVSYIRAYVVARVYEVDHGDVLEEIRYLKSKV